MKVYYAMAQEELDRRHAFLEMESRVRGGLSPETIAGIKAEIHAEQDAALTLPLYETEGGVARIAVEGTLAPKRYISDDLYGDVTTYGDIARATRQAGSDPLVNRIEYHINSPGGAWDGIEDCAEAIKNAAKPTRAIIHAAAQSGGYYLASQAGKIYAATAGSLVGSIGVAAEVFDRTVEEGQKGIKRHVLTNRASPDKRPRVDEEEGREIIIDRLDQLYAIFENRVVEGRSKRVKGFDADTVRSLSGRSVTAERALELGLIDGILTERSGGTENAGGMTGGTMKLSEFIEQNPGAKEEILNYAAAELGLVVGELKTAGGADEAVASDRARTLELLELSGVRLSESLRNAVAGGEDSGEYAKKRLREVNGAMGASNGAALGNPKPAQKLEDQIAPPENRGAPAGAVTDEKAVREMARRGGF